VPASKPRIFRTNQFPRRQAPLDHDAIDRADDGPQLEGFLVLLELFLAQATSVTSSSLSWAEINCFSRRVSIRATLLRPNSTRASVRLTAACLDTGLQFGDHLSLAYAVAAIDGHQFEHAIDRTADIDRHEGLDQALQFSACPDHLERPAFPSPNRIRVAAAPGRRRACAMKAAMPAKHALAGIRHQLISLVFAEK
jgi:hypothetical protein